MTSSLVGSEMCIRDRLKPNDSDDRNDSDGDGDGGHGDGEHINSEDENENCLLYTSDAADDM
eukprot:6841428-Prorocentrum_lima.AAC.1